MHSGAGGNGWPVGGELKVGARTVFVRRPGSFHWWRPRAAEVAVGSALCVCAVENGGEKVGIGKPVHEWLRVTVENWKLCMWCLKSRWGQAPAVQFCTVLAFPLSI